MTPELAVLASAALLQALQLGLMSIAANRDRSPAITMTSTHPLHSPIPPAMPRTGDPAP